MQHLVNVTKTLVTFIHNFVTFFECHKKTLVTFIHNFVTFFECHKKFLVTFLLSIR